MKKILVVDVDTCGQCPLIRTSGDCGARRYQYCELNGIKVEFDTLSSNCPLKQLPVKLETDSYMHDTLYHYMKGWNELLSEIEN